MASQDSVTVAGILVVVTPKTFFPIFAFAVAVLALFVALLEIVYQDESKIVTLLLDAVQVADEPL